MDDMEKICNTGLVLEGGAMRGMFSAGVMDVLMEHGVEFDDRGVGGCYFRGQLQVAAAGTCFALLGIGESCTVNVAVLVAWHPFFQFLTGLCHLTNRPTCHIEFSAAP